MPALGTSRACAHVGGVRQCQIGGEGDVEKFQQENLRRRAVTPARAPAPATTFSSAGYDQGVGTSISISIDAAAPDAGPGAGSGAGSGAGAGASSVAGTPAKPQPDNDSDDDDESTHATPAPSPAPSAAGSHASPSKDSKSAPKKSAKKRPRVGVRRVGCVVHVVTHGLGAWGSEPPLHAWQPQRSSHESHAQAIQPQAASGAWLAPAVPAWLWEVTRGGVW